MIDEVDKAPRDFPNDILNEIENMYFRISEIDNTVVQADLAYQPIVVITSNSEKDLPDAFLRRCIFYNIPFPNKERLSSIVAGRLGTVVNNNAFLNDALDLFYRLRGRAGGLRKKPATAELLGWIISLRELADEHIENPLSDPEIISNTMSNLIKTATDQDKAKEIVHQWIAERNQSI